MKAWLVRAGQERGSEQFALDNSIIGIGWPEIGDYSAAATRLDVKDLLQRAFPDRDPRTLGRYTGELWRFKEEIQVGDLAVLPLQTRWTVAIGRVTGSYRHEPGHPHQVTNVRAVEWLKTSVPRDKFDDDLNKSLNVLLTVKELKTSGAAERLSTLAGSGFDPGATATAANPASAPPTILGDPWAQSRPPTGPTTIAPGITDPDTVGRGASAHFATLCGLVDAVRSGEREPLDGSPQCPYDLAWFVDDLLVVAEVKSITADNEAHQVRYGLGQVLHYRHVLRSSWYQSVQAVLVVEREPRASVWAGVCREAGVLLAWPSAYKGVPGVETV